MSDLVDKTGIPEDVRNERQTNYITKRGWYAAFLHVCLERGNSVGRAYYLFCEKFKEKPPREWYGKTAPIQPTAEQLDFVIESNIAYAKARKSSQVDVPEGDPTGLREDASKRQEETKQNKPGRKRKYESDAERQKEHRKRKKHEAMLKLLTRLEDTPQKERPDVRNEGDQSLPHECPPDTPHDPAPPHDAERPRSCDILPFYLGTEKERRCVEPKLAPDHVKNKLRGIFYRVRRAHVKECEVIISWALITAFDEGIHPRVASGYILDAVKSSGRLPIAKVERIIRETRIRLDDVIDNGVWKEDPAYAEMGEEGRANQHVCKIYEINNCRRQQQRKLAMLAELKELNERYHKGLERGPCPPPPRPSRKFV